MLAWRNMCDAFSHQARRRVAQPYTRIDGRRRSRARPAAAALILSLPLTQDDVRATYAVIKPHIRVTPTVQTSGVDFGLADFLLTLKLEQLQHAGSFKTRGAFAHLLMRDVPDVGVVAASGGNHGSAVAYAAMRRGVPAP